VIADAVGRRFARLATDAVVRRPGLWRLFRGPLRRQFEQLAPSWDARRSVAVRLAAFEVALDALDAPPRRALDLGTGTGDGALAIARRFPDAEVVGVDLAGAMVAEARRKTPPELAGRVRFEVADAARLPFADGAFDLVAMNNMIPFFDETARVLAPAGWVVLAFALGPQTPIYVARERLERELRARGFSEFADFSAGSGTALVARLR
jgi:ubiquinone/menaquinone biosynthesis C-methylase UbiE